MQIEKKGAGPWPEMKEDGVLITLQVGEDIRTYDIAALQADEQVTIDVVRGHDGRLAEGIFNGTEYVANLVIPAAHYEDVPQPTAEGADPEIESVRVPLTVAEMAVVKLVLWTITENMEA